MFSVVGRGSSPGARGEGRGGGGKLLRGGKINCYTGMTNSADYDQTALEPFNLS